MFSIGGDPVEAGLVSSLSRPAGNLTGVTTLNARIGPKRLELLHEVLPAATIVAAIVNPSRPTAEVEGHELQTAAQMLGLHLQVMHARVESDFEPTFEKISQLRCQALMIGAGAFFTSRSEQLAALTVSHVAAGSLSVSRFREGWRLDELRGRLQ